MHKEQGTSSLQKKFFTQGLVPGHVVMGCLKDTRASSIGTWCLLHSHLQHTATSACLVLEISLSAQIAPWGFTF